MATDIEIIENMKNYYDGTRNGETYGEIVSHLQKSIVSLSEKNKLFNIYIRIIASGNMFLKKEMENYFKENKIYFSKEQYDVINRTQYITTRDFTDMFLRRDSLNLPSKFKLNIQSKRNSRLQNQVLRRFVKSNTAYELPDGIYWDKDGKRKLIDILKHKPEISGMPLGIKWNKYETDQILDIAAMNGKIRIGEYKNFEPNLFDFTRPITFFPKGLDLKDDRLDRAFDIIENSEIEYFDVDLSDTESVISFYENNIRKEIFPIGIDYDEHYRKRMLDIAEKKRMPIILPRNIEWTSSERQRIIDIARTQKSLFGIPENIKWTDDEKQELFEIVKSSKNIIGLPQDLTWTEEEKQEILEIAVTTGNLYSLPQNEEWKNFNADAMMRIASFNVKSVLRFPDKMDFTEEENKSALLTFLESNVELGNFTNDERHAAINRENADKYFNITDISIFFDSDKSLYDETTDEYEKMISDLDTKVIEKNLMRRTPNVSIRLPKNVNWSSSDVDRLIRLFQITKDYNYLPTNVDYTTTQIERLTNILGTFPRNKVFLDTNNPKKIEILSKIFGEGKKRENSLNTVIKTMIENEPELDMQLKYYDPITCIDLSNGIHFDYAPSFVGKNVDELTIDDIKHQKEMLLQIYDRLTLLGVVNSGIEIDEKKYGKIGEINQRRIRKRLEKLDPNDKSDRIQIATNLGFWINKLTKYIDIQIYTRVFQENQYYTLADDEIKKKLQEKESLLINSIRYLHGGDPDLEISDGIDVERNSSYTYFAEKYNVKSSFSEYLKEEWITNYNRTGNLKLREDGHMKEFNIKFNEVVKNLMETGRWTKEELISNFEYISKSLDMMGELYRVKDTLITQFMQYGIKEEYKDELIVRKKEGSDDKSYGDVLYVFAKDISRPLSFHCSLEDKDEKDKIESVSQNIDDFCNVRENGINVIYPLTDMEKREAFLKEEIIELVSGFKNGGKYKKLFDLSRVINSSRFPNYLGQINEFIKEVLKIEEEDKSVLDNVEFIKQDTDTKKLIVDSKWENVILERLVRYKDESKLGIFKVPEYEGLLNLAKGLFERGKFVYNPADKKNYTDMPNSVDFTNIVKNIAASDIHKFDETENGMEFKRHNIIYPFTQGINKIRTLIGYKEPNWEDLSKPKKTDKEIIEEQAKEIEALKQQIQDRDHTIAAKDKTITMQQGIINTVSNRLNEFVDKVKKHPIGRFLFRRTLKSLPEGKEETEKNELEDKVK